MRTWSAARRRELNFPPETEFAYCNAGYVVLADVVARCSGRSFKAWTGEKIFRPLGMAGAFFRDDLAVPLSGTALSYSPSGDGRFEKVPDNGATPGPGSLFIKDSQSRF